MKRLGKIFEYFKGNRLYIGLALLFALISVFSKMAIPYISGLAIQKSVDALKISELPDVKIELILLAIFLTLGTLFRYFYELLISFIGQRIVKKMRDEAYKAILDAPLSYLDKHYRGDLMQRLITDIDNIQTGLILGGATFFEGLMTILITIAFMFRINWIMALATILLTPISILVSSFISRRNSKYYKKQSQESGIINALALESINNREDIKSYGLEGKMMKDFHEINESLSKSSFKAVFASSWVNPSTRLVNNLIYAILAFLGAFLIVKANQCDLGLGISGFGVGALSAALAYAFQYMTPFNEISNVASEVSYSLSSFSRVDELINSPKDIDEGEKTIDGSIETIDFNDLSFSYDKKKDVIKKFNVSFKKGKKIALVGQTGCGKTTILSLLLRFYDPQKGEIRINGIPAKEIKKSSLRKHLGMVLQDSWLFEGSIKENVSYGKKDARDEEIIEACKKARAHSFIMQLPDGYNSKISGAASLSLGQRQLLCVARLFLLEPEIIILDEATSNIDLKTELELAKSFDDLMKGKTSFVVAHRLSTIKNADQIIVMDNGEIKEIGDFKSLLEKDGLFKKIHDSQFI